MFKNYILTAWRHILKNRLFSAINVFGLAIGLMSCILILLYVKDEVTYDTWVPNADKIVRIHSAYYSPDRPPFLTVRSAGRIMEALETYASAEIEKGVRLVNNQTTVIHNNEAFTEQITFADASFFDIFDLPFVAGDAQTSFAKPLSTILTEELAIKYFGRTDVVGETMTFCCMQNQQMEAQVAGVIKDIPDNSHFSLGVLVRMEPSMFDFAPNILNTWSSVNVYTYFKLRDGKTAADLQDRYNSWLNTESVFVENADRMGGDAVTDFVKPNVMPLLDLHLHARRDAGNMGDLSPMGDINMVYTFSGVALMILLIASINFMNLATARASKRAREVALRKVMGASRAQVAWQFLGEAVAIAGLGLLFALVAVELALPLYNEAIGKSLTIDYLADLPMLGSLVLVAIAVGLISGSYPAAHLSRFLPARILKANKSSEADGSIGFRQALVVFQFTISIGLAMCTAVIYAQTMYAGSKDLGFTKDSKLAVLNFDEVSGPEQAETIRQALAQIPGVTSVVLSSEVPSQDFENNTGFMRIDGGEMSGDNVILNYHALGFGFLEAYGVEPVAGRTFSDAYGTDEMQPIPEDEDRIGTASVILNESAVRSMGFSSPEEAVGQTLRANVFRAGRQDMTIVGVVPDIYFRSLKFGVRPTAYWVLPPRFGAATITYAGVDSRDVTVAVERVWRDHMPLTPISHQHVSDMLAAQYDEERRQAKLFAAFSGLAIVVACLGLYGLASFTAEQRTKEIGIRKVLGARVRDIVQLLVWQFSRPVLLANILAWPIGWYLMTGWLEGFQYRLDDGFVLAMAAVAGGGALLIAWLTVAGRAIHVAQANPIHALRYE